MKVSVKKEEIKSKSNLKYFKLLETDGHFVHINENIYPFVNDI